jgi:manganese/zinc/iron transport system permease protein
MTGDFLDALFFASGYNATVVALGCAAFGLAAGAIGCFVLLRGRALISDAAAHATLPGVAGAFILAFALGLNARDLALLLAGAGLTAALAVGAVAALNQGGRLRDDASMALVLSIGYGVGVVLFSVVQSLPTGGQAGLNSFILGQAAGMSAADATLIAALALASALCLLVLFKPLTALCFDSEFAAATGLPVRLLDGILLALMLAVAVAGLRAVGLILVVGLMVIPAVAARLVTDRLGVMVPLAAAGGAVSAWVGTAISAATPQLPTGATIALTACALFLLALLFAPRRGALAFAWRQARLSLVIARDHALRGMIEAEERGAAPRNWRELAEEAGWSRLQRAVLPAWFRREGWVTDGAGGALTLLPNGLALAKHVTHGHRVWEHYLQAAAGLPPQAEHRAADEVEHALPGDVAADAEAWLRSHDPARLSPGAALPPPGEHPSGAAR